MSPTITINPIDRRLSEASSADSISTGSPPADSPLTEASEPDMYPTDDSSTAALPEQDICYEPTTYLITGANRGIGLGLTSALLQRPNHTIIAAVRSPHHSTAEDLHNAPTHPTTKLIIVKIDSLSQADASYAAEVLQTYHSITKIDTVIANAGIGSYYGPAVSTPVDEFTQHFQVNALAPMVLFQAMWPLLRQSPTPKFIAMSSRLASIEGLEFWAKLPGDALGKYMPAAPYGGSKAMLNYLLRRLHFDIAFPLSPGWVQTAAGDAGANQRGMKKATVSLDDSVHGMLDKIDHATKEKTSGKFLSFDDAMYDW